MNNPSSMCMVTCVRAFYGLVFNLSHLESLESVRIFLCGVLSCITLYQIKQFLF